VPTSWSRAQESFSRQPFAEGLILKTARGPRYQPRVMQWRTRDARDSIPYLRVSQTHGDSVLTLPADSQVCACRGGGGGA
jgi:hypothetical protein